MKTQSTHRRKRGFTLVELMVVIVIIAILASLAFMMANRANKKARAAAELSNIRNCGIALTSVAAELRYYPMGWDGNKGKSWAGLVADELNGNDVSKNQAEFLWSPVFNENFSPEINIETITHFSANPAIMTDVDNSSTSTPKDPKFLIRVAQLRRPAEQIILCGAVSRGANTQYSRAHAMMWQMRGKVGGTGGSGTPPKLDISNREKAIEFPEGVTETQQFGSLPDFFRYGTGKGLFLFVDGSAKFMSPTEHKQKNWASNY